MATLSLIHQITLSLLDEDTHHFGQKADTATLTVGGQVFDTGNVPVADNFGQTTLWVTGQGGLTSFDFIAFISDVDVWLEIANTAPATDERMYIKVLAGIPLILPSRYIGAHASNVSRFDSAVLVEGTDYDEINSIVCHRDTADLTGDATVRLMLVD